MPPQDTSPGGGRLITLIARAADSQLGPGARLAAYQRYPYGLGGTVLLDVFQHGGSEPDFAGKGRYEWVLSNHRLQIARPMVQPGPGGAGEHEEHARKDRIPAEPGRTCGSRPAAADGLGLVLEQTGVLDQLLLGVLVALLLAADLLRRPLGTGRVRRFLNVGETEPAREVADVVD